MDETYQFVALDVFQVTVGERHECTCGDQGLHHVSVTVISIVGREFGSRGVRTGVSIRHGTPRRRSAACSPQETQISRIGETTPSGPIRHRKVGRPDLGKIKMLFTAVRLSAQHHTGIVPPDHCRRRQRRWQRAAEPVRAPARRLEEAAELVPAA
jgi:hypothetical protein